MSEDPTLSPGRLAGLRFKAAQLANTNDDLIDLLAADLVTGDRLSWGGELFTVTDVRSVDTQSIEVNGIREGWSFPIEFFSHEQVRVALPRPANAPGPNQGAPTCP